MAFPAWRSAPVVLALSLALTAAPALGGSRPVLPAAAGAGPPPPPPVLVYVWHQVAPPGWPLTHGWETVTPAHFARDCAWIASHHLATLTAKEFLRYLEGRYRPSGPALYLTFDNGLEGVYRFAFPILERYRLHATLFVIAHRTLKSHAGGRDRAYLTWPQLRAMLRSGLVDVQAEASGLHGWQRVLGQPEPLVDPGAGETLARYRDRLASDFAAQRRAFLTHLGYAPTLLVWPFSARTPLAAAVARRYGIRASFLVGVGFAVPGETDAVPRNSVSQGWENLPLSVLRLERVWRTGDGGVSVHYLLGGRARGR
ncbi:MAG: polysaccharide deacetylase family protein [Firmicutes bacterium]|nr:polysaccharide deacetylase family protein [Bacillota bacterium]